MYDPFNKNAHGNRSHFRTMRKEKATLQDMQCKINLKIRCISGPGFGEWHGTKNEEDHELEVTHQKE